MEQQRFEFQKPREFGDIIGDTFRFMIQHIKPFITGFIVFVLPLFLLGTSIMIPLMKQIKGVLMEESVFSAAFISIGSLMFTLGTILGSLILYALVYAIVDAYQDYPGEDLTIPLLWAYVPIAVGKILIISVVFFAATVIMITVLMVLPAVIHPSIMVLGSIVALPLLLYLIIRFIFTPYIYVSEGLSVLDSFRQSAYLVQDNWWWTFLTLIVLSLITTLVSYIFVLPATLYMGASTLLSAEPGDLLADPSPTAMILYGLSMIGSLFVNAYAILGMVIYYYSQKEKKEGHGIMERISRIGEDRAGGFDNEGEY